MAHKISILYTQTSISHYQRDWWKALKIYYIIIILYFYANNIHTFDVGWKGLWNIDFQENSLLSRGAINIGVF